MKSYAEICVKDLHNYASTDCKIKIVIYINSILIMSNYGIIQPSLRLKSAVARALKARAEQLTLLRVIANIYVTKGALERRFEGITIDVSNDMVDDMGWTSG